MEWNDGMRRLRYEGENAGTLSCRECKAGRGGINAVMEEREKQRRETETRNKGAGCCRRKRGEWVEVERLAKYDRAGGLAYPSLCRGSNAGSLAHASMKTLAQWRDEKLRGSGGVCGGLT